MKMEGANLIKSSCNPMSGDHLKNILFTFSIKRNRYTNHRTSATKMQILFLFQNPSKNTLNHLEHSNLFILIEENYYLKLVAH